MLPELRSLSGFMVPFVIAASVAWQAPSNPKPTGPPPRAVQAGPVGPVPLATFSVNERGVIRVYFQKHPRIVKPLPPGIAKHLVIGRPLPLGVVKTRLPEPLLAVLPILPGYQRVIVGDRVVLLSPRGIVADILTDVLK